MGQRTVFPRGTGSKSLKLALAAGGGAGVGMPELRVEIGGSSAGTSSVCPPSGMLHIIHASPLSPDPVEGKAREGCSAKRGEG